MYVYYDDTQVLQDTQRTDKLIPFAPGDGVSVVGRGCRTPPRHGSSSGGTGSRLLSLLSGCRVRLGNANDRFASGEGVGLFGFGLEAF